MLFIFIILDEDGRAFVHQIYIDLRKEMLYMARVILDNKMLAEDAVQDAFINIMKKIDDISTFDKDHRAGYCIKVVRNASRNINRKAKKAAEITAPYDNLDDDIKDDSINIEDMTIMKEDIEDVVLLIAGLESKYKQPLLMKFADGISYKDISETLNITEATARKRVQRAIEKLAREVQKEGVAHG